MALGPVGGVDTHAETHTAAAVDAAGRLLGHATFTTTTAGYSQLTSWLAGFGFIARVGVEGTSAYGAGLTRHLRAHGIDVIEVDRPDRRTRRLLGKSDPLDAEAAARAVLAGVRAGTPKDTGSTVEALRVLRVARRGAVTQRADTARQIKTLLVTAPEALRAQLRDLRTPALIRTCAALRPGPVMATSWAGEACGSTQPAGGAALEHEAGHAPVVLAATKTALKALARRHLALSEEIDNLEASIIPLVEAINPTLLALPGVGPDCAGQLLVTAGANADRVHSEAALAMLTGVAPIPASSGKTGRHRLNRGGDRQANAAIYRIVITRLRHHAPTRAYVARRTAEGLSRPQIIRCLKRHLVRELYQALRHPHRDQLTDAASPRHQQVPAAA